LGPQLGKPGLNGRTKPIKEIDLKAIKCEWKMIGQRTRGKLVKRENVDKAKRNKEGAG
jgi:hypothetical protein